MQACMTRKHCVASLINRKAAQRLVLILAKHASVGFCARVHEIYSAGPALVQLRSPSVQLHKPPLGFATGSKNHSNTNAVPSAVTNHSTELSEAGICSCLLMGVQPQSSMWEMHMSVEMHGSKQT